MDEVCPCLIHLDLWTQNILTVNGRITAILDFDRGLYGDPELEFAVLDTYGYSSDEFFEGYGKPRTAGSKAQIRQRLYVVYELIKYAFIRTARGRSFSTGRSHVAQCKRILQEIE
ncbi:MAG: fructosamine kinase family protein [Planctomycetota bacterium]